MQAEWKIKGLFKADAQRVADEIGENSITPEQVLEKARNDENSELHKCFEWNDGIAAEKYRLIQARKIIINLAYVPKEKTDEPVRCFQITREKSVYMPTKQFLVNNDEYQDLLKRAKVELESFKRRYATLSELEIVFEAIESI
mgnify:FL=1